MTITRKEIWQYDWHKEVDVREMRCEPFEACCLLINHAAPFIFIALVALERAQLDVVFTFVGPAVCISRDANHHNAEAYTIELGRPSAERKRGMGNTHVF